MINSKKELKEFIERDRIANSRSSSHPSAFGDEIWKFLVSLRKGEYYSGFPKYKKIIFSPLIAINRIKYHNLSLKLGFSIPMNVADKGLCLPHYGTIVISHGARIGKNVKIHEGVNIGATNGEERASTIGDNVFIGTGAKIIGALNIANDVAIGANAVVTKSIDEPGTTWAGVPARKISDNNSHLNLAKELFD